MSRTILIGIARMGSTRFPGKVLKDLGGMPVLKWVVRAGKAAKFVDEVWIATSNLPADDAIESWCRENDVGCFRGDESDVLSRFAGCATASGADIVIRVTCDCPFIDPAVIDTMIELRATTGVDYCTNIYPPTWPDGLDCEVFTTAALNAAYLDSTRPVDRECVTTYLYRNRDRFTTINYTCPIPDMAKERWVLDTEEDYKLCQAIAEYVRNDCYNTDYLSIKKFLDSKPELRKINNHELRNSRYFEGLSKENYRRSFSKSSKFFETASSIIPFGAQTFSKSYLAFGKDGPLFLSHGLDGRCFDIDGNDYVDLVGALLPNILGYCDTDVDTAVRRQLDSGTSFSLATRLESEVASRLIKFIPCAEMVKFGKSGSDAVSAAVRLAKAHTGRNKVVVAGGYHGWHDWAVNGTEKGFGSFGVPDVVRCPWGDIASIGNYFRVGAEPVAAIVVEPEIPGPEDNYAYLQQLRHFASKYGALLIFDEVITAFRWSMGGAQQYWGVAPDLTAIGKSMGNGLPISAVVGRAEIMERCAPRDPSKLRAGTADSDINCIEPNNIFFSGTFNGEALSLAGAKACIDKLDRECVSNFLWFKSQYLIDNILELRSKYGLDDVIKFGHGPLYRVQLPSKELGLKFTKKMAEAGVLIHASHNLCHAHTQHDLAQILNAYEYTFKELK